MKGTQVTTEELKKPKPISLLILVFLIAYILQVIGFAAKAGFPLGPGAGSAAAEGMILAPIWMLFFPAVHVAIASRNKEKRNSRSRRQIFFGWFVFFAIAGVSNTSINYLETQPQHIFATQPQYQELKTQPQHQANILEAEETTEKFWFHNVVEREGKFYEKFATEPFSGEVYGIHSGAIVNGRKEGPWEEYNSTEGEICDAMYREYSCNRRMATYLNGKEQGIVRVWLPSGQLSIENSYVNGKKDGVQSAWDESGELLSKTNYVNGKKD
ncbi:MAG: hypothetical protein ACI9MF_002785 [Gammaproteobacteria bacterium]|jgi:hypothetical protein